MKRTGPVPAAFSGKLHAYFDQRLGVDAVRVLPNEYVVTADDILLTTVLGSCVAACVRDPVAGIGGMNHFMLPAAGPDIAALESQSLRYGANAMNMLIETLYAHGARRERLEAKVFGGAMIIADMKTARIGDANASFVIDYLREKNIQVFAQDLNDRCARQVHYFPATGRAMVKRLAGMGARIAEQDRALADKLVRVLPAGDAPKPAAIDIEKRRQEQVQ